jgi:hypothetical protein
MESRHPAFTNLLSYLELVGRIGAVTALVLPLIAIAARYIGFRRIGAPDAPLLATQEPIPALSITGLELAAPGLLALFICGVLGITAARSWPKRPRVVSEAALWVVLAVGLIVYFFAPGDWTWLILPVTYGLIVTLALWFSSTTEVSWSAAAFLVLPLLIFSATNGGLAGVNLGVDEEYLTITPANAVLPDGYYRIFGETNDTIYGWLCASPASQPVPPNRFVSTRGFYAIPKSAITSRELDSTEYATSPSPFDQFFRAQGIPLELLSCTFPAHA